MKLSEAILLGSMKRPKTKFSLVNKNGTCALGAALDATNKLNEWESLLKKYESSKFIPGHEIDKFWVGFYEELLDTKTYYPVPAVDDYRVYKSKEGFVRSIIIDLNDLYGWSRESIAKWIAKLEKEIETYNSTGVILESKEAKVEETINV